MTTHHIYLLAPGASPDDVRRFYGQALGLTEYPKPSSLAHISVLWFEAGPIKFHVGYPEEGIVGDGHTALAVADVEAAREQMKALGYAVDDAAIPMGYPRFYVRDPWGNQFEILPEGLP
ncbi:MAG: VOC family protein [Armatimonadetes bacterium]|nr:VOC family protein [Armatimonadota bacterium]